MLLLLMELSRVHDLVMLDRPDTESFITQADFHCTYKIIVTIAYTFDDCLSANDNRALCWYNLETNYALIKRLDKAVLIEDGQ